MSVIELKVLIIILSAFLAGSLASFAGLILDRVPRKESIIAPPSHCDECYKPLAPYDLLPVISYFVLGGKCRNCKATISRRGVITESAAAAAGAMIAFFTLGGLQ